METDRLVLRVHRLEDFSDLAALWSDPVVPRFISGIPQTPEESWSRLLRYAGHWAVEEKATRTFLGEVGFADMKRTIEPPLGTTPETGWVFASSAHGKWVALEAVQAIHAWGANHFQAQLLPALFIPKNESSIWQLACSSFKLEEFLPTQSYRSLWDGFGFLHPLAVNCQEFGELSRVVTII